MTNINLTNHFQDVLLVSLASWSATRTITPCDQGGPYMVTQEGYDPEDMKMLADEFVLGRSGKCVEVAGGPVPAELDEMGAAYQAGKTKRSARKP